jgi:hypothetical protein
VQRSSSSAFRVLAEHSPRSPPHQMTLSSDYSSNTLGSFRKSSSSLFCRRPLRIHRSTVTSPDINACRTQDRPSHGRARFRFQLTNSIEFGFYSLVQWFRSCCQHSFMLPSGIHALEIWTRKRADCTCARVVVYRPNLPQNEYDE